jgi:hypothetical protein
MSHEMFLSLVDSNYIYCTTTPWFLHIQTNSTLCVYSASKASEIVTDSFVIESSTLRGGFLSHIPLKFGTFKIVLFKKSFFLCCPTKCKNQTKIHKNSSKLPLLISSPPFTKSTLYFPCYFIKILVPRWSTDGLLLCIYSEELSLISCST